MGDPSDLSTVVNNKKVYLVQWSKINNTAFKIGTYVENQTFIVFFYFDFIVFLQKINF